MAGLSEKIYARLPTALQHAAVTTYGFWWRRLRFGGGYPAHVRAFAKREPWTSAQWGTWQDQALRGLLERCAAAVPAYRDRWSAEELSAARQGQLAALPLLEKDALRADPRAFLREDQPVRRPLVFHTSGSTGTPIATYWTVDELRASMALREVRSARWAGCSFSQPRATFSGRTVVPDPSSPGPFHRYNAAEQQVYFSPFHLAPQHAEIYLEALRRHRVEWLTGYAVSMFLLARFCLDLGLQPPTLRACVTTSEKVEPAMRTTIEAAFGCKVFEEYSTVENVLFASECREHRLHVSPEAGVIEILRPDGEPAPPGEVGEVVATGLLRTYQPLVRFRLGDLARWSAEPCPCGLALPVIEEVVGRLEDVVVGPDGRELVRFHGVFVDLAGVRAGQVVQESIDQLVVRVIPTESFDQATSTEIVRRVESRLGAGVSVSIEVVDSLLRNHAGKVRAVISKVSRT